MITRQFNAVVKRVGQTDVSLPVQVRLSYNSIADPLVVRASFHAPGEEPVEWDFARDLLSAGSRSLTPYGAGDVRFRLYPAYRVILMCLRSPEGHCDIALPAWEVHAFLDATRESFVAAEKDCVSLVDDFLKELFEA